MRILCVNALLKVVSPYDLSILSMSVIQENWIEWGELYIGFFDFWNVFYFAKPQSVHFLLGVFVVKLRLT